MRLTRRRFLRNMSMTSAAIRVGLPPLAAMFNMNGTAYAATAKTAAAIPSRFLFWFNGNGIPERYWIRAPSARITSSRPAWRRSSR